MDTEVELQQRHEALEGEITELRAEIDQLRAERRAAAKAAAGAGGLWILGPSLVRAFRNFLARASLGEPLPREETAELAAAMVRRFFNVGLVGLVIAALPLILLNQQNRLIERQNAYFQEQNQSFRDQVERQASDARIARRAQLLDIIYGQGCDQPEASRQAGQGEAGTDALSPQEEHESSEAAREERVLSEPHCWASAPIRARAEAALAFIEIERGHGIEQPDLSKADLSGANLRGAQLANVNLSGARLAHANLRSARLAGSNLRSANLRGASLDSADLQAADLIGADFRSTKSRTTSVDHANLTGADLSYTDFRGVNITHSILRKTNLLDANLLEADIKWADFRGAELPNATLLGANLFGADLRDANLYDADLRYSILSEANLSRADLSRTLLNGADFDVAILSGADLRFANLQVIAGLGAHGVDFRTAIGLTSEQLKSTFGDGATQLPVGVRPPRHWQLSREQQRDALKQMNELLRPEQLTQPSPPVRGPRLQRALDRQRKLLKLKQ